MNSRRLSVLFVSWEGPETSYMEGLFLPIFAELKRGGIDVSVLQFSWGTRERQLQIIGACAKVGVPIEIVGIWRFSKILGALLTVILGLFRISLFCKSNGCEVIVARSILPVFMVNIANTWLNRKVIFDADGLPLDERVEFAGLSPRSFSYRILRDIEAQAVRTATIVLTRTRQSAEALRHRAGAGTDPRKIMLVGNGRDAAMFKASGRESDVRDELRVPQEAPLIVYVGSLGKQYCVSEMVEFVKITQSKNSDTHFLVLSGSSEFFEQIKKLLPSNVICLSIGFDEIARYISAADLGLAFRASSYSMQAVEPVKVGEYLLCGVPVLSSKGVGRSELLTSDSGRAIDCMRADERNEAALWFLEKVMPDRDTYRTDARRLGQAEFSLSASASAWRDALRMAGSH